MLGAMQKKRRRAGSGSSSSAPSGKISGVRRASPSTAFASSPRHGPIVAVYSPPANGNGHGDGMGSRAANAGAFRASDRHMLFRGGSDGAMWGRAAAGADAGGIGRRAGSGRRLSGSLSPTSPPSVDVRPPLAPLRAGQAAAQQADIIRRKLAAIAVLTDGMVPATLADDPTVMNAIIASGTLGGAGSPMATEVVSPVVETDADVSGFNVISGDASETSSFPASDLSDPPGWAPTMGRVDEQADIVGLDQDWSALDAPIELVREGDEDPGVPKFDDVKDGVELSKRRVRRRVAQLRKHKPKSNMEYMLDTPRVLRAKLKAFITWPWFDRVVLLAILLNCIALAVDSPRLDEDSEVKAIVHDSEIVFTLLFTAEMIIKMMALGLFEEDHAYFRSAWNWLDFVVVCEALLSTFNIVQESTLRLTSLRAIRALRPLRGITRLPGLQILVNALLHSIPLLCNTLIVCIFYFVIFGIVGTQLWMGALKQRCFWEETGLLVEEDERMCGARACGDGQFCGKWISNPNNDVTSFDNILWAFNTIFQSITLEGWADIMYKVQDASAYATFIYFVLLILFGAFILINLTLAVIMTKFHESMEMQEKQVQDTIREMRRRQLALAAHQAAQAEKYETQALVRTMTMQLGRGPNALSRAVIYDMARRQVRSGQVVGLKRPMAFHAGGGSRRLSRESLDPLDGAEETRETRQAKAVLSRMFLKAALRRRLSRARQAHRAQVGGLGRVPEHGASDAGLTSVPTATTLHSLGTASSAANMLAPNESFRQVEYETTAVHPKQRQLARPDSHLSLADEHAITVWAADDDDIKPSDDSEISEGKSTHVPVAAEAGVSDGGNRWPPASRKKHVLVRAASDVSFKVIAPVSKFLHKRVRLPMASVVEHNLFSGFIILCIVLNTIVLSLEYHGMDPKIRGHLETANHIFTWIFTVEMAVKLSAVGFSEYCSSAFNVLDATIVIVSLVELFTTGQGVFAVFRLMRVFRLIRLMKYLPSMVMIVEVVSAALPSFGYVALLLLIFCFVYAILGMHLFGEAYLGLPVEDVPRNTFEDLSISFITVFQILSGEAWNEIMFEIVGATGRPVVVLYFVSWVILGQFMLLNLFLAVLLDGFGGASELQEKEDRERVAKALAAKEAADAAVLVRKQRALNSVRERSLFKSKLRLLGAKARSTVSKTTSDGDLSANSATTGSDADDPSGTAVPAASESLSKLAALAQQHRAHEEVAAQVQAHEQGRGAAEERGDRAGLPAAGTAVSLSDVLAAPSDGGTSEDGAAAPAASPSSTSAKDFPKTPPAATSAGRDHRVSWRDRHLFCITPGSWLHLRVFHFVSPRHPLAKPRICGKKFKLTFDAIVMFLILVSSIQLAVDGPNTRKDPVASEVLDTSEVVLTILFTIEIVVKVFARGFVLHRGAYLRNGYNVIDFCVVVSSLCNVLFPESELSIFRSLRIIRCLRPLRLIARNQGMRVVVDSLLMSAGAIMNVIAILAIVWLMFAIFGVQRYAGKFRHCNDPDFPERAPFDGTLSEDGTGWEQTPCDGSITWTDGDGIVRNREIVTPTPNFDNTMNAMLLLFTTASGEGWPAYMFQVSDVTQLGLSPKRDASPLDAYFFVAFTCVGAFFFLNLFVGVVFDNFMRLKRSMDGFGLLTDRQRQWVEAQRQLMKTNAHKAAVPPRKRWRRSVFTVVTTGAFDGFIMTCILGSVLCQAIDYEGASGAWRDGLEVMNVILTGIFIVEASLKVIGLGFAQYWDDGWNRFDFVVVVGSVIDLIFTYLNTAVFRALRIGRVLSKVFRMLRISRGLRLARSVEGLKTLLMTLNSSIPSLVNVGSLLCLLFFIYAVSGVTLFGHIENTDSFDEHANFSRFRTALLTLFRMATGEGWEGFMFDAMDPSNGGSGWAWMYFVSFVTIAQFIVLNLFIMIIVEDFESADQQEGSGLVDTDIEVFKAMFSRFDPDGTSFIPASKLEDFLRLLPPPMGLPKNASFGQFVQMAKEMALRTHAGRIHFRELLLAAHRVAYGVGMPEQVLQKIKTSPEAMHKRTSRALRKAHASRLPLVRRLSGKSPSAFDDSRDFTIEMYATAVAIQRMYRNFRTRMERRKTAALASPQGSCVSDDGVGAAGGSGSGSNSVERTSSSVSELEVARSSTGPAGGDLLEEKAPDTPAVGSAIVDASPPQLRTSTDDSASADEGGTAAAAERPLVMHTDDEPHKRPRRRSASGESMGTSVMSESEASADGSASDAAELQSSDTSAFR